MKQFWSDLVSVVREWLGAIAQHEAVGNVQEAKRLRWHPVKRLLAAVIATFMIGGLALGFAGLVLSQFFV